MLPPFGLWLINLIMSKEFYITSLDNNMNRGTFQGVFAFFFIFLLGRNVRRGQGEGTGILPRELRFAAKWLYELCFWFSMPDETVATRPPWLDSSLPRRPCRGISVLRSTILQPLSSFAMRSRKSTYARRPLRLRPLRCGKMCGVTCAHWWPVLTSYYVVERCEMMCCTTYRYLYFLWESEVCGRGGGYTVS